MPVFPTSTTVFDSILFRVAISSAACAGITPQRASAFANATSTSA